MKERQRQLLIELRRQLVGLNHVLPFTVYTDKDLDALLDAQPKSIEELIRVKGFPASGIRVKGYGEAIIAVFSNPNSINQFKVEEGENGKITVGTIFKPIASF